MRFRSLLTPAQIRWAGLDLDRDLRVHKVHVAHTVNIVHVVAFRHLTPFRGQVSVHLKGTRGSGRPEGPDSDLPPAIGQSPALDAYHAKRSWLPDTLPELAESSEPGSAITSGSWLCGPEMRHLDCRQTPVSGSGISTSTISDSDKHRSYDWCGSHWHLFRRYEQRRTGWT